MGHKVGLSTLIERSCLLLICIALYKPLSFLLLNCLAIWALWKREINSWLNPLYTVVYDDNKHIMWPNDLTLFGHLDIFTVWFCPLFPIAFNNRLNSIYNIYIMIYWVNLIIFIFINKSNACYSTKYNIRLAQVIRTKWL